MTLSSLLPPKVSSPAIHLPRERLSGQMLAAHRLCLLEAPGGFGKTALLRESLAQLPADTRYAWLALHGRPVSSAQLCGLLARQLGLGREAAPEVLLDCLRLASAPLYLVLDDYPTQSPELDAWLIGLLEEGAPVRFWVSARQRPCWPLARLSLEGDVIALGADSLALTREEFSRLLPLIAGSQPEDFADELWEATLGWCAMVRLALQGRDDPLRPSALRHREYVRDDLLARLSEAQRHMLRGIAHLPRVSAALCAELWPELDASRQFAAQLLVLGMLSPLDTEARWWHLHPVVARALADELVPREASRLRLHACRLLREDGFVGDAVELALQEGQVDTAASYMERVPLAWLFAGQHLQSWLGWRERLSANLLESTPFLIYLNAQALLIGWRLDEAQACIDRLGWQLPQPCAQHQRRMLANWEALQGTLFGLQGHGERARKHCRSALEDLDSRDWHSIHLCYSTLARIALSQGQVEQAETLLGKVVGLARRQGCLASEVLIDTDRIRLLILTGEWALAGEVLGHDFELLRDHGAEYPLLLGRLLLLQAELAILNGDAEQGESLYRRGFVYARRCSDPFILHAGLGLSEAAIYRGDLVQAETHLHDVRRHLECQRADELCYEPVLGVQALRVMARQQRWAEILGRARRAVESLSAPDVLPPLNAPSLRYRAQQLLALTLEGLGDRAAALEASRRWRETCERLGFVGLIRARPEANNSMRAGGPESSWCGVDELPDATLARVLTPREMGVLRLMAEGLTNQEISGRLFISLNTVKAHTIHINHKLGVKRRTQAVRRARELGLLA